MIKRTGYGQEEADYVQDTTLTTYATSTTEFIGADRGQVIAAKTIKVGPGFKPIEGTEEIIQADLVLLAMGFTGAENHSLNNLVFKAFMMIIQPIMTVSLLQVMLVADQVL